MQERRLLPYLKTQGYPVFDTWAVVGNGPLHLSDRLRIATADIVIRFNDANNRWRGERTDLHVVRHPSWYSFSHINAPQWDVAAMDSLMPKEAQFKLYVYESQHEGSNKLNASTRIFEECNCGNSCLERKTWAGPSTGAAVVSELQSIKEITTLDIFGFNGMGDEKAHIDFANKTIIENCCTKCTVHKTASNTYGNETVLATFAAVLSALIVFAVLVVVCARHVIQKMQRGAERRPLLTMEVEKGNP